MRRNLGAFLGRADHRNDGPVVADSAACRSVAVVVAVVVRSDVRDDCDLVDDRIPQMAQGKLTTKFQTETLPDLADLIRDDGPTGYPLGLLCHLRLR